MDGYIGNDRIIAQGEVKPYIHTLFLHAFLSSEQPYHRHTRLATCSCGSDTEGPRPTAWADPMTSSPPLTHLSSALGM